MQNAECGMQNAELRKKPILEVFLNSSFCILHSAFCFYDPRCIIPTMATFPGVDYIEIDSLFSEDELMVRQTVAKDSPFYAILDQPNDSPPESPWFSMELLPILSGELPLSLVLRL